MASKDRFQRRARAMQKYTGWSYSECLRLARENITDEALAILMTLRGVPAAQGNGDTNQGESK